MPSESSRGVVVQAPAATTVEAMTTLRDTGAEDHDRPDIGSVVRTYSGQYVDLLNPKVDDINIVDIAHHLSMLCRYNGGVNRFYSVGEHSIHVARHVWRRYGDQPLAFAALIHDAPEAYLGDMVHPMKHYTPAGEHYLTIERQWEDVIEEAFFKELKGTSLNDPRIKEVDTNIRTWEQTMFRDTAFLPSVGPAHTEVREVFLNAFYVYGHMEP